MSHPMLGMATRIAIRRQGRSLGLSRAAVNSVVDGATDDVVDHAAEATNLQLPPSLAHKFGALGDGSILQKLIDFITSPEGQAFIKFIISLFIAI